MPTFLSRWGESRQGGGVNDAAAARPFSAKVAADVSSLNAPTAATKRPSAALVHLDLLRGISAVAVLAQHLRGICFGSAPADAHVLSKDVDFVTGLGDVAVVCFFVLSGFFIGTSVLDSMAA